ncbi:MAG TPA: FAD/NAD(P)-binding protein, partial [Pyrinomonadaceae bacterium]|nr:FAD/NAD(P)-binding protein [Pyrinomonadaceae bacterium]
MANDGKMIVAVIGGGLSGTLVAAHLLTRRLIGAESDRALRVLLIEREARKMTRGVAYGTADDVHLLNVPACNMSAYPDAPDHFLRWCERADLPVGRDTFVPRKTYGVYLRDVLEEAGDHAAGGNELEQIYDEVISLEADERAQCAMLRLRYRGARYADRVVIACGNYAPTDPTIEGAADFYARSPLYTRDPWREGALDALDPTRPVLLVGTGLTMIDVALSLKERGFDAPLYALSRHGHLPQAHAEAVPLASFDFPIDGRLTTRRLFRAVRRKAVEAAEAGSNWRAAINNLRPLTQKIWQELDEEERRRFLRHARAYWEVHRHRMAPEIAAAVGAMVNSGQLKIHAGRLVALRQTGDWVEVA